MFSKSNGSMVEVSDVEMKDDSVSSRVGWRVLAGLALFLLVDVLVLGWDIRFLDWRWDFCKHFSK
jgi:hypothetical protein